MIDRRDPLVKTPVKIRSLDLHQTLLIHRPFERRSDFLAVVVPVVQHQLVHAAVTSSIAVLLNQRAGPHDVAVHKAGTSTIWSFFELAQNRELLDRRSSLHLWCFSVPLLRLLMLP
ncbi:MAG: hypothetical protein CMI26_08700 [Opitutae bacterium]|nr:hypothetical protein [Opitutae bacterium]